jgi:hypothetical protein
VLREKLLAPKPEELVRQLWLEHLIRFYETPASRLVIEVQTGCREIGPRGAMPAARVESTATFDNGTGRTPVASACKGRVPC